MNMSMSQFRTPLYILGLLIASGLGMQNCSPIAPTEVGDVPMSALRAFQAPDFKAQSKAFSSSSLPLGSSNVYAQDILVQPTKGLIWRATQIGQLEARALSDLHGQTLEQLAFSMYQVCYKEVPVAPGTVCAQYVPPAPILLFLQGTSAPGTRLLAGYSPCDPKIPVLCSAESQSRLEVTLQRLLSEFAGLKRVQVSREAGNEALKIFESRYY